ncbi:hypothetical protein EWM58_06415 [Candidatus Erwinia dacicola]|nr:hypothetical protein [Candidatus Erwinia dacicola]
MPDCQFYQRGNLPLAQRSAATLATSYRDQLVKFVVALNPGMSDVFTPASLHSVTLPLLVIAAGYYIHAQTEINLGVDRLPLLLLHLPQAGHFDFLSLCQPAAITSSGRVTECRLAGVKTSLIPGLRATTNFTSWSR